MKLTKSPVEEITGWKTNDQNQFVQQTLLLLIMCSQHINTYQEDTAEK